MKFCADCKIEKDRSKFGIRKSKPDGLYNYCKECKRAHDKLTYTKYSSKRIEYQKGYYELNKETILKERSESGKNSVRSKKWHLANPEKSKDGKKRSRMASRDKIAIYNKEYKAANPETVKKNRDNYRKNNPAKLADRKKKFNSKPLEKLKNRIRKRTWEVLRRTSQPRSLKFEQYIGCTTEELKAHIVSLFTENMTWELLIAGEIHIDHIIPLASATTAEEIYKLCHFSNLQPLWELDNLKKNKY